MQEIGGFFSNGIVWGLVVMGIIYLWRWEGDRNDPKPKATNEAQ